MIKKIIQYQDGNTALEASVAYPQKSHRPIVIVCHAWNGRDGFIQETIEKIAGWGFVGFALDVYGKGMIGQSREENLRLKTPFLQDRHLLKRRLIQGVEVALALKEGDSSQVAALGFGFGGLCALDLARHMESLKGAISVYGHFEETKGLSNSSIRAKILLQHGASDPIVPIEELQQFGQDLDRHKIDWQAHLYGNTLHAFMNSKAHDLTHGVMYQPTSAARSWRAIHAFLEELFV